MIESGQKWEISTTSWIRGVLVIALAYAIFQVRELVLVVLTAIVIASAIEPVVAWARRRGVPRLPMVLLIFILVALALLIIFYYLLMPLIADMANFIRTLSIYSSSINSGGVLSDLFKTQNLFGGLDTPAVVRELSTYLNSFKDFLSQGAFSSISSIFGGILNFVLIVVLSFHLVVQEDGIAKFLRVVTPIKNEEYIIGLWRRAQRKIGLWMQGQLLASSIVMVLVYVGLLIADVPHALLLAVIAGVLDLVPFIGPIVASIPAIFVGFIFGGPTLALIVALIYLLVQQFENYVIYPMVHDKLAGVPPMISILSFVVGGILAGFLGVLIAVPMAAVAMELVADFEQRKLARSNQ